MGMKFSLSDETKTADLADDFCILTQELSAFLFYRKFAFPIEYVSEECTRRNKEVYRFAAFRRWQSVKVFMSEERRWQSGLLYFIPVCQRRRMGLC